MSRCACDLWGRFADLYLELLSGVRGSAACNFSLSDSILTAIGACDCCLRSGSTSAIRGHSLSLGQTIFTVWQSAPRAVSAGSGSMCLTIALAVQWVK